MQNTDNALFKDMVRAAEQDSDLKIIRGGPKNQIVAIKEGNKIYHPVGAKKTTYSWCTKKFYFNC
jgi:hypothetical protein